MNGSGPRIAAVIAHADDAGLLERCIAHHLAVGVDRIFVSLNREDDASEGVARRAAARDARIRVAAVAEYSPDTFRYFTAAVDVVRAWARPDWMLFVDSDEFWIPARGSICAAAHLAGADVLAVPRYNAPPLRIRHGGDPLAQFDPFTALLANVDRTDPGPFGREGELRWVFTRDHPKLMVRPEFVAEVGRGAHTIVSRDPHWRGAQSDDLLIVHLPFTTRGRFRRKLTAIRERLEMFGDRFAAGEAWHWRRWIELDDAGSIDAEFDRQLLDLRDVARLRSAGALVTPRDLFARTAAACR